MTAFVLRKAGIWQYGDVFSGICAQVTYGIIHLRWPGGTIHSNDVHIEGLKRGEGGANFGTQEHRPGLL